MVSMSDASEFLAPWWEVEKVSSKVPKPPNPPVRKERVQRIIPIVFNCTLESLIREASEAITKYSKYGVASFKDFSFEWVGEHYDTEEMVLEFTSTETDAELAVRNEKYKVALRKWKERHQKFQG